MELTALKKALADRAEAVCQLLLPDGKLVKGEWVGGRLASGVGGHSLNVQCHGEKAGRFKDFGGTDGGSNLLELWIQAKGIAFQDALAEAKEWLKAQGVDVEGGVKRISEKRTYRKPDRTGIVWIADKAQFYLTVDRRIPRDIVEEFKIAMKDDGLSIVFPYLSETPPHAAQMIKYLKLERDEDGKKVTWTSKETPKVLFGKHRVRPDDRALLICEGESDAMTWAALRISGLCVTSVPFGAKWEGKDGKDPNDEWIQNDWEFIQRFERIYLSMDMDEAGRMACASIAKRLGREICFIVMLPEKDANELQKQDRSAELLTAYQAAKTLDPAALKNANEFRASVLDRMFSTDPNKRRGIPLPFGKYPFHFRWNEITLVTGANGSGKTQLLGFLLQYLKKLGYPSCVASMEVISAQTLEFYTRQCLGEENPSREKAERALDWLAEGFWFYDRTGRVDWRDLIATWRYAYRRHGLRFFVLDSWMKLGIKSDDFDAQGEVINALSEFVGDCDVHVFLIVHPRKLKSEDEQAGKFDVKGSGQLTDEVHNIWTVWRNKKKEKEIEQMLKMKDDESKIVAKRRAKPDTLLLVSKQRNDRGDEPTIDLWYVPDCKQFFGHFREKGICYLEEETPLPPEPCTDEQLGEDVPF